LKLKLIASQRNGEVKRISYSGPIDIFDADWASRRVGLVAGCAPDETLVGGGYANTFGIPIQLYRAEFTGGGYLSASETGNLWRVDIISQNSDTLSAYAQCLRLDVGVK
jgi:hypothetical protein